MLISITVRNETAAEINKALGPISKDEFDVSMTSGDAEMTTLDINFEEDRDLTILEAVTGILAFRQATKDALLR